MTGCDTFDPEDDYEDFADLDGETEENFEPAYETDYEGYMTSYD